VCAIGDDCLVIHKTIKWPRLPHITVTHCYFVILPAKFATVLFAGFCFFGGFGNFLKISLDTADNQCIIPVASGGFAISP